MFVQILVFYAEQFGSPDQSVKHDSVQALIVLFSAAPRYIKRKESIRLIASGLGSRNAELRRSTLVSLTAMLEREEIRVGATPVSINDSRSAQEVIVNAGETDHHCFTDGMRSHTATVQHLLLDGNRTVKLAALRLKTLLLRQGLVDPSRSVATFIALQCDQSKEVSHLSLQLLRNPDYGINKDRKITGYILEGIALAFQKQMVGVGVSVQDSNAQAFATFIPGPKVSESKQRVRTRGNDRDVKACFSFLGPLWSELISKASSSQRRIFFEVCVSAFKHTENLLFLSKSQANPNIVHTGARFHQSLRPLFLKFLTVALGTLPFAYEDDVVCFIYTINQVRHC